MCEKNKYRKCLDIFLNLMYYYGEHEKEAFNMSNYNKNKLMRNLNYYIKLRNVKVGDLEEGAGVSVGYLSRWKNDGKDNSSPTVETLSVMAEKLNVSLDILCYVDIESLTPTELKLLDYLNSFIDKTKNGEFVWERITKHQAECTWPGGVIDGQIYPFMKDVSPDNYNYVLIYNSLFDDSSATIEGNIYKFEKGNKTVYITKIGRSTPDSNKISFQHELYLETSTGLHKICNIDENTKADLDNLLKKLYEVASISARTVKLDEKLQNELNELFNEDEELPF